MKHNLLLCGVRKKTVWLSSGYLTVQLLFHVTLSLHTAHYC
jgi:hypothetical protein